MRIVLKFQLPSSKKKIVSFLLIAAWLHAVHRFLFHFSSVRLQSVAPVITGLLVTQRKVSFLILPSD